MRIAIFGLGAVGGHFAARLANAGYDVSVVARGATLEAVRRDGLTLRSGEATITVHPAASDKPGELGPQDYVIATVKTTDPQGLAAGLAPMLGAETAVVFAQNGIPWWYGQGIAADRPRPPALERLDPDGALARTVAAERVIGAVINSSNEVAAPGVVVNNSPKSNALLLGEADDRASARVEALRTALQTAGVDSPPVPDIRQAIWRKLMVNMSASILCLLCGHKATFVRDDPRIAELYLRIAREGLAIAAAHGIDLSAWNPEAFLKNPPDHLPSIRQDYDRGRALELDSILLAPQAFARAASLDTPCLDAIAALAVRQGLDAGVYRL
jgi:2-dehydropantoate 2-reductase